MRTGLFVEVGYDAHGTWDRDKWERGGIPREPLFPVVPCEPKHGA